MSDDEKSLQSFPIYEHDVALRTESVRPSRHSRSASIELMMAQAPSQIKKRVGGITRYVISDFFVNKT